MSKLAFAMWIILAALAAAGWPSVTRAAAPPGADQPNAATRQQAAAGNAKAEVALADDLFKGGTFADKTEAIPWYRKAAAQGNRTAEFDLGMAYLSGDGVMRNVPKGARLVIESYGDVSRASPDEQAAYAFMVGKWGAAAGMPDADAQAAKYLRLSAQRGSLKGTKMLGMAEMGGLFGIPRDPAAAKRNLTKVAQAGDSDSQVILGELDIIGRERIGKMWTLDVPQGLHWLRTAAKNGRADAAGMLAYFTIAGKYGVAKDPAASAKWATQAVRGGNFLGYYARGLAYQAGDDVPVDPAKAFYNFAVAQRLDQAHQLEHVEQRLSAVAAKLSPQQISELRAAASKIQPPSSAKPAAMIAH